MSLDQGPEVKVEAEEEEEQETAVLPCTICAERFSTPKELGNHILKAHCDGGGGGGGGEAQNEVDPLERTTPARRVVAKRRRMETTTTTITAATVGQAKQRISHLPVVPAPAPESQRTGGRRRNRCRHLLESSYRPQ